MTRYIQLSKSLKKLSIILISSTISMASNCTAQETIEFNLNGSETSFSLTESSTELLVFEAQTSKESLAQSARLRVTAPAGAQVSVEIAKSKKKVSKIKFEQILMRNASNGNEKKILTVAASSSYATSAAESCTYPTTEEFFANVPPQYLSLVINEFLKLFPPGTAIEDAIAQVAGCKEDNPNFGDGGGSSGGGSGGGGSSSEIIPDDGSLYADLILPFDACKKSKYVIRVNIDLSGVNTATLQSSPVISVMMEPRKPQTSNQALLKPEAEGAKGGCLGQPIFLVNKVSYDERLDVTLWKKKGATKLKTLEPYGSWYGYGRVHSTYCVKSVVPMGNKKASFIVRDNNRTDATGICVKLQKVRQELNGY